RMILGVPGGTCAWEHSVMTAAKVTVDNFARVESDRMLAGIMKTNGTGVNEWTHNRVPAPLDKQPVIRQNRDTLYSVAVADISEGATLALPDAGDRYVSAMVVNQDHYVNGVFHDAGQYELTLARYDTPFVAVAVRTLVNPDDPGDVAAVAALQDQMGLTANSA